MKASKKKRNERNERKKETKKERNEKKQKNKINQKKKNKQRKKKRNKERKKERKHRGYLRARRLDTIIFLDFYIQKSSVIKFNECVSSEASAR